MTQPRRWTTGQLTLLTMLGLLASMIVTPTAAEARQPCVNFASGNRHDGFNNTNVSYDLPGGFQDDVAGSSTYVDLDGSGNCPNPGSAFLRVQAHLWDGTGTVQAFLQVDAGDGQGATVEQTAATVNDSGFGSPAYSNIFDAQGQRVRGCGIFSIGDTTETRCTEWVTIPAPTPEEAAAQIKGTNVVDVLAGSDTGESIATFDGADTVNGRAGDDQLYGGNGSDYLAGGAGADTLVGGPGADQLVAAGDGERDVVRGGDGYDTAWVDAQDEITDDVEEVYVDATPPCARSSAELDLPGCQTPPGGLVTSVTASTVEGEAWDPDSRMTPISVHLYVDDQFVASQVADEQVDDFYFYSDTGEGFRFDVDLAPGQRVQVYGIGIDRSGTPDDQNESLRCALNAYQPVADAPVCIDG